MPTGRLPSLSLPDSDKPEDIKPLVEALRENFHEIRKVINTIGMSMGYRVTVTVASASTDTEVVHKLGVVADGFSVVKSSLPCRVWTGDTAWDKDSVWIQADKGVVLDLLCFVDSN